MRNITLLALLLAVSSCSSAIMQKVDDDYAKSFEENIQIRDKEQKGFDELNDSLRSDKYN